MFRVLSSSSLDSYDPFGSEPDSSNSEDDLESLLSPPASIHEMEAGGSNPPRLLSLRVTLMSSWVKRKKILLLLGLFVGILGVVVGFSGGWQAFLALIASCFLSYLITTISQELKKRRKRPAAGT